MYNYLPHPSNMRTSSHVLKMRIREGAAGYGIYMMLLELLRDADGRKVFYFPEGLAYAINEPDVELVKRVCEDYGLFNLDKEDYLTSPWLDAQMAEYDAKKQAAIEAGRRGAAKRYAKQNQEENQEPGAAPSVKATHRDPMGGAIGSLKVADSNKPNLNNINQDEINPTQAKSKLLAASWGRWDGDSLFRLARDKGNALSSIDALECANTMREYATKDDNDHNVAFLYELAQDLVLSHEQYLFLREFTENGLCGTPAMRELVRIHRAWKSKEFRPKYPFDYIVCKLLDL